MDSRLRKKIISAAKKKVKNDLSHDFNHLYRVLVLAERIGKAENADLDVVIPAALFHDVVVYKGTDRYKHERKDSADIATKTLYKMKEYPRNKISEVAYAILTCSFSRSIGARTLEAKVVHDADLLESTGAISIMRTFSSSMVMHDESFYNYVDPMCKKRTPDPKRYSLDLFFSRLLIAHEKMHTRTAKDTAFRRTKFLVKFLEELNLELRESDDRIISR